MAVFAVALLASLGVHLPVYEALGVLAEVMLNQPKPEPPQTVEFELAPLGEIEKEVELPDTQLSADVEGEQAAEDEEPPPELARRKPPPLPEPEFMPTPKPEPEPEPEIVKPEPPAEPVVVPDEPPNRLAVTQKSEDPNVEAPENARFIAEENRRVEEETVANVRNQHEDHEQPDPGRPNPGDDQQPGSSDEQEVADLRNVDGEDSRSPDSNEAQDRPVVRSMPSAGQREATAVTHAPRSVAPTREQQAKLQSGSQQSGGEDNTIVVEDGMGSFRIRKSPEGRGALRDGGKQVAGRQTPHRHSQSASDAHQGANLRLSFSQFEQVFGSEELARERQAYLEQRRSKARGSNHNERFRKYRAAIENYVPDVRPGNQTALNAAASPFAHYLATIHRRIHQEFAFKFLRRLPYGGPFSDYNLHTRLEIVINGDGTIHKVGVVKTSGFSPFDLGAFNAVMDAAPFEAPPRKILSGNGRLYVHWGFYRDHRACGTFNARPIMLPHPPDTPQPGQGPLRDPSGPAPRPGEGELGHALPPAKVDEPRHVAL
ncbi:MAG: TonB C-terminal domain-containing protein [Myxococcales bacterium]|nr:TonB C-terminal domain-containing protein [Myxococcales bacterium]